MYQFKKVRLVSHSFQNKEEVVKELLLWASQYTADRASRFFIELSVDDTGHELPQLPQCFFKLNWLERCFQKNTNRLEPAQRNVYKNIQINEVLDPTKVDAQEHVNFKKKLN